MPPFFYDNALSDFVITISYIFLSIFKIPFLAENACDILKPERKEPKEEPP